MKKQDNVLYNRLKQYTSAGAAFLLTTPISNAAIISTSINPDQTFGVGQSIDIDINNDGNNDLRIQQNGATGGGGIVSATPLNGAALMGSQPGNWAYPYALAYGGTISAGQVFDVDGNAINNTALNSYGQYGNWAGGNVDAYLGIRFDISGSAHFGYIHLNVIDGESFTLMDYAYENTPGAVISAGIASLPVELSRFSASAKKDHINLAWQTESELHNEGFEIQRATKDFEWETIGWADGRGTTLERQTYAYDDREARIGILYYYRLKQVDFDGQFEYSDIVTATIKDGDITISAIAPNPVIDKKASLYINFNSENINNNEAMIHIIDAKGAFLKEQAFVLEDASTEVSLNLEGLAAGIYFVKIRISESTFFQKLMVQ